jgi:hypothetical protein
VIYSTKFRAADELIKTARGLFGNKANFSTLNDKIVINAPDSTAQAVLKLFAELDRQPRTFLVATRTLGKGDSAHGGVGLGTQGLRIESGSSQFSGKAGETLQVLEGTNASVGSGADRVNLKLQALGEKKARAQIFRTGESSVLATEIDLTLGKWQSLGGIAESKTQSGQEILSRVSAEGQKKSNTEIRVTLLPQRK